MEKLKRVLQRHQMDRNKHITPWLDFEQDDEELQQAMAKALNLGADKKPADAAPKEGEDGDVPKFPDARERALNEVPLKYRKRAEQLLDYIQNLQAQEREEDLKDGIPLDEDRKPIWTDEQIHEIKQVWEQETGAFLNQIDDPEEFKKAWIEWVEKKISVKYGLRQGKPSFLQQKEAELRQKDPVYRAMVEEFDEPQYAKSLVSDEFIPTKEGHHQEITRIDANKGRYTYGFRHYESYELYVLKYPRATIEDYVEDSKFAIFMF